MCSSDLGYIFISFITLNPIPRQGVFKILLPARDMGFSVPENLTLNATGQNIDFGVQISSMYCADQCTITIQFVPRTDSTSIISKDAVNAGSSLLFTVGPSIQLPGKSGLISGISLLSATKISNVEYIIDCAGQVCATGSTEYQPLSILIIPNILQGITLTPASLSTRSGLSQDTRGNNPAILNFTAVNQIPAGGRVRITFPQDLISYFAMSDPGCPYTSIFDCMNIIVCKAGCSEDLKVSKEVSNLQLTATRSGNGSWPAGITISLLIQTFTIPPGPIISTSSFNVCTETSQGSEIDCATLSGLPFQPAGFQNISMLDPFRGASQGAASCFMPQPAIILSNTGTNQTFFFNFFILKTTNKIPFNGSINIDIPRVSLTVAKVAGSLLPANVMICSPNNASAKGKNLTNSTQICGKSSLINVSFLDTVNSSLRLTMRVSVIVPEDSVINISLLGRLNGTGSGFLRNKYWSGPVAQYRVSTTSMSGGILDQQIFFPMMCNGGNISNVMITEIVSNISNSSVCLTNSSVGGTGQVEIPLLLPFFVPSNVLLTIRVFLPPDFKISNSQNVSLNISKAVSVSVRSYVTAGPQYWTGRLISNRTILNIEFRTTSIISASNSLILSIGAMTNAPYVIGYPTSSLDYGTQITVLQFLVSLPDSTTNTTLVSQFSMFRFELLLILSPLAISNVRVSFSNTALAQAGIVNISFLAPYALNLSSQFAIRFPTMQGINVSAYGFTFNVSNSSQGTSTINWAWNSSSALTTFVNNYYTSSDLAAPYVCSLNGSFCSKWSNCTSCSGSCNPLGSDISAFSSSEVVLQVNSKAVRYAYFYVPEIDGVVCNVSEPVQAQPFDWIVPQTCNISGVYANTTRIFQYVLPSDIIPAGTLVTLTINNVLNPSQYGNCTGWFDIQVKQQFDPGWMIIGRAVSPCQMSISAGPLDVIANSSNLDTGKHLHPHIT